jgi:hypothetical protein
MERRSQPERFIALQGKRNLVWRDAIPVATLDL